MAVPVVIIGAGPVGLVLALGLARQGVAVHIVDQGEGCSVRSKALTIQPRTLEQLWPLGVVPTLLARGLAVSTTRLYADGAHLVTLDLAVLSDETSFPYVLHLPQGIFEAIVRDALRSQGVRVERQTALRGLAHASDGVRLSLEGPDGASTRTARWVVGCDGARSTVRTASQIPFEAEGPQPNARIIMGDVAIPGMPFSADARHRLLYPGGFVSMLPTAEGWWRVIAASPRAQRRAPPDLAELSASLRAAGLSLRLRSPRWLTSFLPQRRLAARYGAGPVLLAGDAAHVHSPVGAQGMNMGVQDALSLSWRLARVIRGEGPSALVETYRQERRAVAAAVLARSTQQTREVVSGAGAARWRRYRDPVAQAAFLRAGAQLTLGRRAPELRGGLHRRLDGRHDTALWFQGKTVLHTRGSTVLARVPDPDGRLHTRYNATAGAVCSLQPDGHIGDSNTLPSGVKHR